MNIRPLYDISSSDYQNKIRGRQSRILLLNLENLEYKIDGNQLLHHVFCSMAK